MDSYFVCLEGIKSKLVTHFCHRKTPSYGMIRLFFTLLSIQMLLYGEKCLLSILEKFLLTYSTVSMVQ